MKPRKEKRWFKKSLEKNAIRPNLKLIERQVRDMEFKKEPFDSQYEVGEDLGRYKDLIAIQDFCF